MASIIKLVFIISAGLMMLVDFLDPEARDLSKEFLLAFVFGLMAAAGIIDAIQKSGSKK